MGVPHFVRFALCQTTGYNDCASTSLFGFVLDRNRNKIIDYEIGDRSKWTYFKLYTRIKNKYKVNYLCTDGYEAYSSFTLAQKKHTTTKAEIRSRKMMCLHNHFNLLVCEV